uniref:Uncharacterized protein n=1 Tax=Arundo donax TaxID=35708 RepID=A0A0A8XWB3_ARUDO
MASATEGVVGWLKDAQREGGRARPGI